VNGDGIYTDKEEATRSGFDVPFPLVITKWGCGRPSGIARGLLPGRGRPAAVGLSRRR
jgi:hypothetical protein